MKTQSIKCTNYHFVVPAPKIFKQKGPSQCRADVLRASPSEESNEYVHMYIYSNHSIPNGHSVLIQDWFHSIYKEWLTLS